VTARRYGTHPDVLADIADIVLDVMPLLGGATATEAGADGREDGELVRRIVSGEGYHAELLALAARYMGRGMKPTAIAETLRGLMQAQPNAERDARWCDRFDSVPELVASAAAKYAEQTQHRRALASLAGRMIRARHPSTNVLAAVLAEAATRGIAADRAKSICEWAAERELGQRGGGQ
jgi:hypothetical protein